MGNLFSVRASAEDQDSSHSPSYYFPPKNGKYFSSSFIMGGDKFEMSQPESYLFGENLDLNYLGGRPSPFPYNPPQHNEPMQMLRALINIRKETLKLVPTLDDTGELQYKIEFVLDTDVDCSVTIYFLCKEELSASGLKYIPKEIKNRSETYHCKASTGYQFSQTAAIFNPQNYNAVDLIYHPLDEKGEFNAAALYPVVIHCVAEEGEEPRQSHSLIAIVEKIYEQTFTLKPIKQKIFVDGLCYLLQEIYGIENKANRIDRNQEQTGSEDSDNSFECVICMSELRDTLILPCRHLCLCKTCANALRYQANNCPICRVPFRALLQVKAVRRSVTTNMSQLVLSESMGDVMFDIPPGFETVPLVEALNGINPQLSYLTVRPTNNVATETDHTITEDGHNITEHHVGNNLSADQKELINAKSVDEDALPKEYNNMKYFYKPEKAKYVVPAGEDSVSASSSSSSNIESIQERTRLLTAQRNANKLDQYEASQYPDFEETLMNSTAVQTEPDLTGLHDDTTLGITDGKIATGL